MRPPPLPRQLNVLRRVVDRIAEEAVVEPAPVVVFGVDGTLYDVRPRTLRIMMEYADEVRASSREVASALSTLDTERVQYLLSDTLRECGLTQSDVVRDATNFWRLRFLSDEYCAYDLPLEGAAEYLRAIYEAGANIVYLSARDAPGMLFGTVRSLRDHGFPYGVVGTQLVLKPDATMGDESFKRGAMPALGRVGSVVAYFDNDPASCNLARELYPDADVVVVENHRAPAGPGLLDDIEPVSDFRMF